MYVSLAIHHYCLASILAKHIRGGVTCIHFHKLIEAWLFLVILFLEYCFDMGVSVIMLMLIDLCTCHGQLRGEGGDVSLANYLGLVWHFTNYLFSLCQLTLCGVLFDKTFNTIQVHKQCQTHN